MKKKKTKHKDKEKDKVKDNDKKKEKEYSIGDEKENKANTLQSRAVVKTIRPKD